MYAPRPKTVSVVSPQLTSSSIRDTAGQSPWTDADYRMAETISSYLANFVRTGNARLRVEPGRQNAPRPSASASVRLAPVAPL